MNITFLNSHAWLLCDRHVCDFHVFYLHDYRSRVSGQTWTPSCSAHRWTKRLQCARCPSSSSEVLSVYSIVLAGSLLLFAASHGIPASAIHSNGNSTRMPAHTPTPDLPVWLGRWRASSRPCWRTGRRCWARLKKKSVLHMQRTPPSGRLPRRPPPQQPTPLRVHPATPAMQQYCCEPLHKTVKGCIVAARLFRQRAESQRHVLSSRRLASHKKGVCHLNVQRRQSSRQR